MPSTRSTPRRAAQTTRGRRAPSSASPSRTRRRSAPAWLATDSNFSDSTGSTHGIAFSTSPPSKATARIGNSREGSPAGDPGCGVAVNSAARAPSTKVRVSFLPMRSAASASRIGTLSRAICPDCDSAASGRPGEPLSSPSTNRSGASNAAPRLRSCTTSAVAAPVADGVRTDEIDPGRGERLRDPGARVGDQPRLSRGRRRAGRQPQFEPGRIGHADIGAGGPIHQRMQVERLARAAPRSARSAGRRGRGIRRSRSPAANSAPAPARRCRHALRLAEPAQSMLGGMPASPGRAPIGVPARASAGFRARPRPPSAEPTASVAVISRAAA